MSDKSAPDSATIDDTLRTRRLELGARLKTLREAQGLTTRGLSQSTRITLAFIEALEDGAFERLPGQVFGRGFVRGLSRQLGADADELLAAYEACWAATVPAKSVLKVEIKNKPVPESSAAMELVRRGARAAAARPEVVRGGAAVAVAAGLVAALVATSGAWRPLASQALEQARLAAASLGTFGRGGTDTAAESAAPAEAPVVVAEAVAKDEAKDATDEVPSANAAQDAEAQELAAASAASAPPAAAAPAEGPTAAPAAATAASTPPAAAPAAPTLAAVAPAAQGEQTLEFVVSAPVKVRIGLDSGETIVKELTPETYRFVFKERAELMIYDAAALKISYNGRPLGSLGSKGRVRRLSFEASGPTDKKL